MHAINRTAVAGESLQQNVNVPHLTYCNDINFGKELFKEIIINGIRHVGPEPVVTPDESAHKINSIKLRELDTNGIVWSTTPSRIARNIGIACTVKYPTWLGKDELDTYTTMKSNEEVCWIEEEKSKGKAAPKRRQHFVKPESVAFASSVDVRNYGKVIVECDLARQQHEIQPERIPNAVQRIEVMGIPDWATYFIPNTNFFGQFFPLPDYHKSTIDIICLRLVLSTIFKLMVLHNDNFQTVINNCRIQIVNTVLLYPFAVDPVDYSIVPFECLFDDCPICKAKIATIFKWIGIKSGQKIESIKDLLDAPLGPRNRTKKITKTQKDTQNFVRISLRSFDLEVIDKCVFQNCPPAMTSEISKACACYQGVGEVEVAEYDLLVDHVASISSTGETLELYMNNMNVWRKTQELLGKGILCSNMANHIWMERVRYLRKKNDYLSTNEHSDRALTLINSP